MSQMHPNLCMFTTEILSYLPLHIILHHDCFTGRYHHLPVGKTRTTGVMLNVSFNLHPHRQTQVSLLLFPKYFKSIPFSQSLYCSLAQVSIIFSTVPLTQKRKYLYLLPSLAYSSQSNLRSI